jgi:hypothetical protein
LDTRIVVNVSIEWNLVLRTVNPTCWLPVLRSFILLISLVFNVITEVFSWHVMDLFSTQLAFFIFALSVALFLKARPRRNLTHGDTTVDLFPFLLLLCYIACLTGELLWRSWGLLKVLLSLLLIERLRLLILHLLLLLHLLLRLWRLILESIGRRCLILCLLLLFSELVSFLLSLRFRVRITICQLFSFKKSFVLS